MKSPFARVAAPILANGYRPIPLIACDKAPGKFQSGQWTVVDSWPRWRTETPAPFILKLWQGWPDANVGVVLGVRVGERDLVAVDFDTDDEDLLSTMESALPPSPLRKRGRRGYTAFYLAPPNTPGRRFLRNKSIICELLTGNGTRQTVVPPSIHPVTKAPYEWLGAANLENTPAADLPVLSQDDLDRFLDTMEHLEGVTISKPGARVLQSDGEEISPHRALNNAALRDLDAWVPALGLYKARKVGDRWQAVAAWRSSSTGRPLEQRKANLSISPNGIEDFGDRKYTPIDLVMTVTAWPLDDAFRWLSERLGMAEEGFGELPPPVVAVAADGTPFDAATGEIVEAAPAPCASPVDGAELPERLTDAPGMLGQVVDWITATARQPNRVLALGAAITVLGTLIGRRIAGPTLSGTHLYIVTLAPSGSGKDHALRMIDPLLKAANAPHLLGPDDFMSMSAMVKFLKSKPLSLCAMDEFGAFVSRITNRRASAHEKGITKVMRSAWGASFKTIRTPEWASAPSEEIASPALSIYGNSTAPEFFAALQGQDVVNGFINRLLLLKTETRAREREPKADPWKVPAGLAGALGGLWRDANLNTPADMQMQPGDEPRPRVMDWSDSAKAVAALAREEIDAIRVNAALDPFYARTLEMAIRLATIRAAGKGIAGKVEKDDMEWGRDVALWSARTTAAAAEEHMAENDRAGYANRIFRLIKAKGGEASRREIQIGMKGELRNADLKDILETMVEAGRIIERPRPKPEIGRPPTSPTYAII